ncbi:hypothetical protein CQA58_06185 [Helicobacter brantae]|uniref:Uncharacterized protein n=1 Tax=Helicobacter brantae TaxID=375927 RepID=A0A3D8IZ64_9HELI|nr:hypothetical protein CQA58_06185 [Helicobacter brantae]
MNIKMQYKRLFSLLAIRLYFKYLTSILLCLYPIALGIDKRVRFVKHSSHTFLPKILLLSL